jgi:hypothetical protein
VGAEKTVLSSEEICSIIRACGESKVTVLKFGDLYLRFGQQAADAPGSVENVPRGTTEIVDKAPAPPPSAEIEATQIQIAEKALAQDELDAKRAQLSQMFIENPSMAEEMMAQGDLIDDDDRDEEA